MNRALLADWLTSRPQGDVLTRRQQDGVLKAAEGSVLTS